MTESGLISGMASDDAIKAGDLRVHSQGQARQKHIRALASAAPGAQIAPALARRVAKIDPVVALRQE